MNKPADDILEQLRRLPLEERERILDAAELELETERDKASGVHSEVMRRADHAVAHPDEGIPPEVAMAEARAALAAARARRR